MITYSISSNFCKKVICNVIDFTVPTRVEFLFRVLLSIGVLLGTGVLFLAGTRYNSIPLRITTRSCQGETQKHGSTCLLTITMSLQIMSLGKFIPNRRKGNFHSV